MKLIYFVVGIATGYGLAIVWLMVYLLNQKKGCEA